MTADYMLSTITSHICGNLTVFGKYQTNGTVSEIVQQWNVEVNGMKQQRTAEK